MECAKGFGAAVFLNKECCRPARMRPMFYKLSLLVVVCSGLVSGCSSSTPQATEEEKKAFSGGPMPEEFRKDLEARRADAVKAAATKAQNNNTGAPH